MITLGHVSLSFYEATASLVQFILERKGWNVALQSGSHAQIFPKVAAGDVDLFVAAWLPYAHADYWKEYGDRLVKVSTLYEDAQLYWAVPDYVPAEAVRSVADLTRPEVAARMTKTIRGTLPDSGLMIGARKIFEHYRRGELRLDELVTRTYPLDRLGEAFWLDSEGELETPHPLPLQVTSNPELTHAGGHGSSPPPRFPPA